MKCCSVDNCQRPSQAKGMCDLHYRRVLRHGSISKPYVSDLDRFEEKITYEPMSGCWLWVGAVHGEFGYGSFRLGDSPKKAHRAAWVLYKGGIPEDLHVLHRCDNPGCVNPDHLFLGTHDDNMKDMKGKGRTKFFHSEDHPNSKLTNVQVNEIRELNKKGISCIEIAKRFPIGKSMANYICNGRSWRHVP